MANVLPDNGDERLEFALPNPIRRRDPRWISIRRVVSTEKVESLTVLAQEIVKQISTEPDKMMILFGTVHARLQRLWQIRERDIPIVKTTHEVEDVAEIFTRLNREGTRVKEADVVLALAAVRNPGWVRDDYLPYRNDLEEHGWDLTAGIFIRTMTGLGRGRARLIEVSKDFWNPDKLPATWKEAQKSITDVLKRLAEVGIASSDLLPSTNSLIPLFVLHSRWNGKPGYQFNKALLWFLLANRDGRYSGSAITSLNEDVRSITEAESFGAAVDSLRKRLRVSSSIQPDEFFNRYDRAGNRFLRLMLYLALFQREAKDWVDTTRIGYDKSGSAIVTGFEAQWHHIYPRNVLTKAKIKEDDIHALANITVLNERTNVNKLSGKEPWRYIQQFNIPQDSLLAHFIPDSFTKAQKDEAKLKAQWSIERHTDFLIERAELLSQAANAFLQKL